MGFKSIKEIRKGKGYTQQYVANLLNITQSSYNRKENGKRNFDLKEALILEDLFSIPISELFKDLKEVNKI